MAAEAETADATEGNELHNDEVIVLFEPPGEMEGEAILTVGSKRIAVNKIYLSQLSDFFRPFFYGNFAESQTSEFVIREVDENEFIEMLLVILPTRKPIDENNVESLLELADRFMIDSLKEQCLWFRTSAESGELEYETCARPERNGDVLVTWKAPCGELESDTIVELGMRREKFAVNKVYLAQHSKVFYDMFYGSADQQTNSLAWTDAEEFEKLLLVILPTRDSIKRGKVEVILKASINLQMPLLYNLYEFLVPEIDLLTLRECISILTGHSRYGGYDILTLLQIAIRCSSELAEYCRTRLPSQAHIDAVRHRCGSRLPQNAKKWLSQLHKSLPKFPVSQEELKRSVRPTVFFDITQENEAIGRIVMELFCDKEPKAAENFRSLCTGERGLDLSGRPLHFKGTRMIYEWSTIYGCLPETIYGDDLRNESPPLRFDAALISMPLIFGPIGSFRIVELPCWKPFCYSPFGRVIKGFDVVRTLMRQSISEFSKEFDYCIIADCGEL